MKIWDEIKGKNAGVFSREWDRIQFISEAEAVACIHVINSKVDVFLQIINASILKNKIPEWKVNFKTIKKELKDIKGTSNIINKLDKLQNSHEYDYIHSFDNFIKHRQLIDTAYHWKKQKDNSYKKGVKFKEFEYKYKNGEKPKKFQSKWAIDITEKYRKKIFLLISEVGNELNRFLINIKKKSYTKRDATNLLKLKIFD